MTQNGTQLLSFATDVLLIEAPSEIIIPCREPFPLARLQEKPRVITCDAVIRLSCST